MGQAMGHNESGRRGGKGAEPGLRKAKRDKVVGWLGGCGGCFKRGGLETGLITPRLERNIPKKINTGRASGGFWCLSCDSYKGGTPLKKTSQYFSIQRAHGERAGRERKKKQGLHSGGACIRPRKSHLSESCLNRSCLWGRIKRRESELKHPELNGRARPEGQRAGCPLSRGATEKESWRAEGQGAHRKCFCKSPDLEVRRAKSLARGIMVVQAAWLWGAGYSKKEKDVGGAKEQGRR